MRVKFIFPLLIISLVLPSVALAQKLDSPQLIVKEPTFAEMSSASVSWIPVDNASEYLVTLNGQPIEVIGNTLYLTGFKGRHHVSVVAKARGYEQSQPSEAVINVRDYGDGSAGNPYMIYTKEDWETFAVALTRNLFANKGFKDEYVALGANIDFEGSKVTPASKNFATGFQGTFDGKGRMLRNGKIEGGQGIGLFVAMRGVIKNLKVDSFVVNSTVSKPNEGKVAVICGGETTGQLYNCIVMNSQVNIIGENAGSYASTVASVLNSPDASVDRCIAMNNKVKVGNTYASAIVSRVTAGTVRNSIAQNNEIYAAGKFSAGISGLICGTFGVVDHCSSISNTITAGDFYSAGVVGEITAGVAVNCISEKNIITVEQRRCAGGVAGLIRREGNLVNCISKGCELNLKKAKEPYAGLIFALAEKDLTGTISNCVALSGTVNVLPSATGYIGIVGGSLTVPYRCSDCYYNDELTTTYNQTQSGRFYGCGLAGSAGSNYDCTFPVRRASFESMSTDSILNRLNAGASRMSSYGAAEWIRGADGFPTIK